MATDICRWIYRPGTNGTHFALTTCKKGYNYLSKIKECEPFVGVADLYDGRNCPICNKKIKIDYCIIKEDFKNERNERKRNHKEDR